MLFRVVIQRVLSEVMKVHSFMNVKVLVAGIASRVERDGQGDGKDGSCRSRRAQKKSKVILLLSSKQKRGVGPATERQRKHKKKCDVRFSFVSKSRVFWRRQAIETTKTTGRLKLKRQRSPVLKDENGYPWPHSLKRTECR